MDNHLDKDSNSNTNADSAKDNFSIQAPSITLPKGGGAIKSIDEKFSVNAANGTASFSVPLPLSPSRNSFMPSISLSYNSGGGNGIFGLGWNADVPSITRKTEKELPQYQDAIESDTFIYSGVEDLVPRYNNDGAGNWAKDEDKPKGITRYRPRIEGSFARIEKIDDGTDVYWKVISKDNITSIFGKSETARIADPADRSKIFKWLLEFSYDDKGNCFQYEYKRENKANISLSLHEKNRLDYFLLTNTYLKRIKYCNKIHLHKKDVDFTNWKTFLTNIEFLLELVLDFGEHNSNNPQPNDPGDWSCRDDTFSNYRAGFEIRTYRLCKRVLMFHNFKELGKTPCLVRSMDFVYKKSTLFTFLNSITQSGLIRKATGTYSSKSFPAMEFYYEPLGWNMEIKAISEENIVNAPIGIDEKNYQWIDLYSEGVSGILTEQNTGWYYKSNNGDGNFTPATLVAPKPSFTGLSTGILQLQDVEGNGKKFLVSNPDKGYFEFTEDEEWLPFRNFDRNPNIDFRDPNLKFLDLNGDGLADILISEDEVFTWHASLGKEGYDDYRVVNKVFNEEQGPNIVFADITQSIVLSDMSGDGLTDIVRIRNGEIVYWPNLGYGRFGKKVSMTDAPSFDYPDAFNAKFIKLADIDGSGTTDIVYLGKDCFKIYFNQSGNSWSTVNIVKGVNPLPFPKIDELINVSVIDLLGSATSCIVWSSPLPADTRSPLLYIDLMDGKKPYIMNSYKNNLGKEFFLEYTSSTKFYLDDKRNGKKWITKLPFPVQCVSKVEVKDRISKTRYANQYTYHHGYYDFIEREFRGFGRVEQIDADTFNNENLDQYPVLSKTWYHTGAFINRGKILGQFEQEYFYNDPEIKTHFDSLGIDITEKELNDAPIPDNLTSDEWREALRACKSIPLRVEIFAIDGSGSQLYPYTSAQHSCLIKLIQPMLENKHAVFMVHESEALSYNYERNPADPRISHSLITDVDEFGNVNESASILYGRKDGADFTGLETDDIEVQQKTHITYTRNDFTNLIDDDNDYRLKVLYQTQTYELSGKEPLDKFYSIDEIKSDFVAAAEINYEVQSTGGTLEKRLIEHVRHIFMQDDLSSALQIGQIQSLALPFESYKLAFTSSLVQDRFNIDKTTHAVNIKVDDPVLLLGKYVKLPDTSGALVNPDNYWIATGTQTFDADNFYEVIQVHDPFGNPPATIEYDKDYHFYIQKVTDAVLSVSEIDFILNPKGDRQNRFNFRTLSPYVMKDINGNRTGVRTDELGMVHTTFVMGKAGETLGDPIDLNSVEISSADKPTTILDYTVDNWLSQSEKFPAGFNLDTDYYKPIPNFVRLTVREQHESVTSSPVVQVSYSYSDGSGHEIMKKIQAEPGDAPLRNLDKSLFHDISGNLKFNSTDPRWVGTGRTILNNKGKPVKQYEPFFSSIFDFEDEKEMSESGVTLVIHYDPLGRVIKTDFPDATFSQVEFDAWKQITYDQVDTVLESQWYNHKGSPLLTDPEPSDKDTRAAWLSAILANTPTTVYLDSMARTFLSVQQNRSFKIDQLSKKTINIVDELLKTRTELDIEGNQLKVTDALDNAVMRYAYDMLGNKIYQNSMDAGERWMLNDIIGKPFRSWNSRDGDDYLFLFDYDELHRPIKMSYTKNSPSPIAFEKIKYGTFADQSLNLCGKLVEHDDTAGVIKNTSYDFKGNLLSSSRQLLKDYKSHVNWNSSPAPDLEDEVFVSSTVYDALNRPVSISSPSTSAAMTNIKPSEITLIYNKANLLNAVQVQLRASGVTTPFVTDINYDAKGQRESIIYGNNVKTTYNYDTNTFRLINLTTRSTKYPSSPPGDKDGGLLQDLYYTDDPMGNITQIEDKAQQEIFYNNAKVAPINSYVYDAIYRLIKANGREHIGQNQQTNDNWKDVDFIKLIHKGDGNAMRNYSQQYAYDKVGNILTLAHSANGGSYTRAYAYNNNDTDRSTYGISAASEKNNQLLATVISATTFSYTHDAHGNMKTIPHLSAMDWDFKDQLHTTTQQTVKNGGTGETTFYVYDAGGQRVKKITEWQDTTLKKEERIYLGGFEIYRNYKSDGTTIELARETLHVMDDKRRIALVETKTKGTTPINVPLTRYQHDNHLGSSCLELNENADIISYEEYHPYGTTSYQAVNKALNPVAKRYRHTGKERDEESGLYYHGARYYLPWLGRWASSDPIGIGDGVNTFAYCSNNPTGFKDLRGQKKSTSSQDFSDPGNYTDEDFSQYNKNMEMAGFKDDEIRNKWIEAHAFMTMPPLTDEGTKENINGNGVSGYAKVSVEISTSKTEAKPKASIDIFKVAIQETKTDTGSEKVMAAKVSGSASYRKVSLEGEATVYQASDSSLISGSDTVFTDVKAKADSVYGNVSYEKGTIGAKVGVTVASLELGVGVNLDEHFALRAGVEFGAKVEFGFKVGANNELKLPLVSLSLGLAPSEEKHADNLTIPPLSTFDGPHLLPNSTLFQDGMYKKEGIVFITEEKYAQIMTERLLKLDSTPLPQFIIVNQQRMN